MTEQFIGAIDEGTSSVRFCVFNKAGVMVASSQRDFNLVFPHPGWVEQDAVQVCNTHQAIIRFSSLFKLTFLSFTSS